MEKEQGKLIIIVSVVFAMVLLCMICTSGSVLEVKSLQACTPDAVSVLDDGRELYDFILDQNDDETNSIVFYSAVSFPFPWELPMGMLYSRRMIRIRRRCVSVQIRICTGIKKQ